MSKKTILVADDNFQLLRALSVRLEAEGYRVVEAQDAIQAVSAARQCNPDLLILDINMPAGDGFTILQRIQAIDELHDVPVIYLTGERSARVINGARKSGAFAVIYKPFDTDQLILTVAEKLGATALITDRALEDLQNAADQWIATRQ